MKTSTRLVVVFLLAGVLAALTAPMAAAAVLATAEEVTTTTVADPNAPQPAVEAPAPAVEEADRPWTTRYLVPAFLLIGAAGLILSLAYYGARVRARYRVVR